MDIRKYVVVYLLFFVLGSAGADILDKLPEITVSKHIGFHNPEGYIFSIYFDGGDLVADIFTDTSDSVSIMGYKISANSMKIIVKLRTRDMVQIFFSQYLTNIDINYYFLVELEDVDGELEYYCNRIDEINTNGFTMNGAVIFDTIITRNGPSINWNQKTQLEKGDPVEVLYVEKEGRDDYNTYDHWYKIKIGDDIHWIFGFYIDFSNRIKLPPALP
jgi:hypothetical protein